MSPAEVPYAGKMQADNNGLTPLSPGDVLFRCLNRVLHSGVMIAPSLHALPYCCPSQSQRRIGVSRVREEQHENKEEAGFEGRSSGERCTRNARRDLPGLES